MKKLNNIYYHDSLLDKLYKYTRFKITLKDSNTENNTEYYRKHGYFNKRLTYIWDGNSNDLVSTIKSFQKSPRNKEIEELLIQWSNKVIDFIKQFWTQHNKDMIEWEKAHDISKAEKRKKSSKIKAELERRKKRILGKRILYYHTVDEKFHDKVKEIIGLNFHLDFHYSQDKRIIIIIGYFTFILHYLN